MKQTLTTVNPYDHQTLHADYYHTPNSKGLVVVFHGMAEHKARYDEFAKTLAEHDFCVLLCDHRGHGESLFDGSIKGHFADKDGWLRNLDDLDQLINQAQELSHQKHLVLLGHSMGSIFARSYFKRHNEKISHLILTGVPAIPNQVGALHHIIKLMAKTNPKKPSKLLYKTSFGAFEKKSKTGEPLSWLSNDPKKVLAYKQDPMCGFYFTKQGFADLAYGMNDIAKVKDYPENKMNTKIWFIIGEDDVTVDMNQIQAMIEGLQHKGYKNPFVSVISGAAHEVLFEEGRLQLWTAMIDFIQS